MESNLFVTSDVSYETRQQRKNNLRYMIFGNIPARVVLYLLSWSAYVVSFMMKNDINLTIIAMVAESPKFSTNVTHEHCYTTDNETSFTPNYGGTLQWSEKIQGYILVSYNWAYIISQIPSNMLTQRFGSKKMLGYSQLVAALCSLNIPWASNTHYGLVIGLKFLQGFASGSTWPAMYALIARWIPTNERSRFMSSFQGFTLGIGLTYPLSGYLSGSVGWPYVFYTTGTLGICWCILWYYLAFESPEIHPRISSKELKYIEENTIHVNTIRQKQIPREIYKSPFVWAIAIVNFGRIWVNYTFLIPGPRYMKGVLGFSIEKNGLFSGLPFICSYASTVLFCYVADMLVTKNVLPLLRVRQLMTAITHIIPGIVVIFIANVGCDVNLVLVLWFAAILLLPASFAGAMANVVDIAPNLAGPVFAFCQTILMSASFLSPLVAFHILEGRNSMDSWRMVFYSTSFMSFWTYIIYHIWSTTQIQSWNYKLEVKEQVELKQLNIDPNSATDKTI